MARRPRGRDGSTNEPTLWVWAGGGLYVGPSLKLGPHSTSVYCLALGLDAPFTLRCDGQDEMTTRSAMIPPRTVHQITTRGDRMMFSYADVTAARARQQLAPMRHLVGPFGTGHSSELELIKLGNAETVDGARIMELVADRDDDRIDQRILSAIEYLRSDPSRPADADELARVAHMSKSHFLRTFAEQTGTSFRRYRLWLRMFGLTATAFRQSDARIKVMERGPAPE